ncbi:MAG: hypothetical protein GY715_03220 [Planctomycetes bacterium]|nr:hypothetical protein [Planctomycetota bacterium]
MIDPPSSTPPRRVKYVPVVGPRLRRLLAVIFALFAVLAVNSVYLVSVTVAGAQYQNWFYLIMFLVHLVLGLIIVLPVIVFGLVHMRNARNRPNKRAIRAGYGLFATALLLFATGIVLTRVDLPGVRFEVNDPVLRSIAYWLHVLLPVVAIWLFILHRLAGRRIKWRVGLSWGAVAAVFAAGMLLLHRQDPRAWNMEGPESGQQYFFPSLARTSTGNFIPERVLDNDDYCRECHADVHRGWSQSVHRFGSFNNPVYEFSIRGTRRALMDRDGNVQGARFCAGCHDPVPFFTGAFDDPRFDDPEYDLASDPTAQAGITCTACHAISHVNSPQGNGDYTITEPVHYPFAFSDNGLLRWINRQLVKAKPEFHKATFLKPLHRTTEFCGTCHKVHLPPELNGYKWLRGQNHFDSFWLSGVSGQGVASFYYPDVAEANCNGCHMPLVVVGDDPNFSARVRDESGLLKTLDHQFPSANTAIPHLLADAIPDPEAAIAAHRAFNEGVMRVDVFGIRDNGRIDGVLTAPIRPETPVLRPGGEYLLETVIRTVKMGHLFTEGTADSNQVWLDVTVRSGDRVIGRSGGRSESGEVDPWSHFVNSFVLDRNGHRIHRRNVEDIFVALYNNQIPPGAADVVHYRLRVPDDVAEAVTVEVALRYRKFDTELMRFVTDDETWSNDLPVMTLARDTVTLPVVGGPVSAMPPGRADAPTWQRWNDYGIGLLRKGQLGELRQAREAFEHVERLGRGDGPLNLARVYIKEGLIQTHAPEALARAAGFDPPANAWSLLWFGAQVAARNGDHAKAVANLHEILRGGFVQAEGRGFDFTRDYRVLVELGNGLFQLALRERGDERTRLMREAAAQFHAAVVLDPENLAAHWGLRQVYRDLGDDEREARHTKLHARYKPDDNARDHAVATARLQYPAANHAAEAIVIYDLHRSGAFGLPAGGAEIARHE